VFLLMIYLLFPFLGTDFWSSLVINRILSFRKGTDFLSF